MSQNGLTPEAAAELARLLAIDAQNARAPYGRRHRTRLTPPPRTQAAARELGKGNQWDANFRDLPYAGGMRRVAHQGIGDLNGTARGNAQPTGEQPLSTRDMWEDVQGNRTDASVSAYDPAPSVWKKG